jgi:hypothetical protein
MPRRCAVLLFIAIGALTFSACGDDGEESTPAEPAVSLLFTQSAVQGSLEPHPCDCQGMQILELRGIAPQVVWFQDRPARGAGQMPAREFARRWAAFGFQDDPPNAALTLLYGAEESDTVVVELLKAPRYDRRRATMTYVVRSLPDDPEDGSFPGENDASVPNRFGAAALFIDTAGARQLPAGELGPGRWRIDLE